MQHEVLTPALALGGLFNRGDLPEEIVVQRLHGPMSPVRLGERYAWREAQAGVGSYEPQQGGTICIMAHEVRRFWGTHYAAAPAAAVEAVA